AQEIASSDDDGSNIEPGSNETASAAVWKLFTELGHKELTIRHDRLESVEGKDESNEDALVA
ncbi:hypothetical protein HK405_006773, partial [Cladochytrium tenue]